MFEFLQYGFMQRAFIAGIVVALLCAVIGLFLVLRRMALLGDGLAHISFGGIAAGMLFGFNPVISALVFSVLGAFGIQKLKKRKVYGEGDIILISLLGVGVLSVVYLCYKELFYITFDESSARASGLPVDRLDTLLVVLTSVVVVLSMRIVGILLVSSLIAIPASTALLIFGSFKKTVLGAMAIAIAAVIAGLISAYYFDLAPGGSIVMVLVAFFTAALILKKA